MSNPRVVCVDSMFCVWGIKKKPSKGQEGKIEIAQSLFKTLQEEKAILIIPSPVITELICPVPPAERTLLLADLSKMFRIVPIDTITAVKAGELWHDHKGKWKDIYKKKGEDGIKNRFKFDILIAATAIIRKVDYLFTEDDGLAAICKGHVNAGPIPPTGFAAQLSFLPKLSTTPITDENLQEGLAETASDQPVN